MNRIPYPDIDCEFPSLKELVADVAKHWTKTKTLLDMMPDECADYIDGTEDFASLLKPMRVTHRYCSETRQMQPLCYFKAKFNKEVESLYTDFGGEA